MLIRIILKLDELIPRSVQGKNLTTIISRRKAQIFADKYIDIPHKKLHQLIFSPLELYVNSKKAGYQQKKSAHFSAKISGICGIFF